MPMEIGEIIKREIKNRGLNHKEFGHLINRHEKTVQSILRRKTIDTDLLLNISKALNHDFFQYFYNESPLKQFKEAEHKAIDAELSALRKELSQKEEVIAATNKYAQSQEEIVKLLKEKEKFLNSL
jgi:plasmid maintenance system antidote protein VapI